jgi:hypothetical protein
VPDEFDLIAASLSDVAEASAELVGELDTIHLGGCLVMHRRMAEDLAEAYISASIGETVRCGSRSDWDQVALVLTDPVELEGLRSRLELAYARRAEGEGR